MFSEHLKYVKYKKINLDGTFFDVYWYFSTFYITSLLNAVSAKRDDTQQDACIVKCSKCKTIDNRFHAAKPPKATSCRRGFTSTHSDYATVE